MIKQFFARISTLCVIAFAMPFFATAETVGVFYDSSVDQISFAAGDLKTSLEAKGFTVEMKSLTTLDGSYPNKKVVIALASNTTVTAILTTQGGTLPSGLGEQAYALRTTTKTQTSFWVLGGDNNGAMYGGMQIAENISSYGYTGAYNNQETPFILNRGMKLNLPFDKRLPTYVGNWSSTSAQLAIKDVWDMTFWKTLFDHQARNRYNVISIWMHHPFPALVKLDDYPSICLPSIQAYDGSVIPNTSYDQRVAFWREVMQYAHKRGVKIYFFNWNIHLEHAKTVDTRITEDVTNTTTIDYMYKSMYALVKTYPDLDGFGISAGDGFEATKEERVDWTYAAMGKAVKDFLAVNPSRKFNLIHRSLAVDIDYWYSVYKPLRDLPNAKTDFSAKYAMGHMYSTPTPKWTNDIYDTGVLGQKCWLTVRNDDYFYFNWGSPQFAREFIYGIPSKEHVAGIYIGSDIYNPTRVRLPKNDYMKGKLEVERRWYMEMVWGRISYNPEMSDDIFKKALAKRYPTFSNVNNLFDALNLVSRALPKVTELVQGTWTIDKEFYPEACYSSPIAATGFRTIQLFATTIVAKGSSYCDIATTAAGTCGTNKSAFTVATEMETAAKQALDLVNAMNAGSDYDLKMAIENVKQISYLTYYYVFKIRGAIYLKANNKTEAKNAMANAYCWWIKYSQSMDTYYIADALRNFTLEPNFAKFNASVLKEYTDLGGLGIPDCSKLTSINQASVNPSINTKEIEIISTSKSNIVCKLPSNQAYSFKIYTVEGKEITQTHGESTYNGITNIPIGTSLSNGVFIAKINMKNNSLEKKIKIF